MLKQQMKNGNFYLMIALVVIGILFYSSSQTYAQQSQISRLQTLLANQPFKDSFATIHFMYGDSTVSIQEIGYFKFVEFFIRKAAHFGTYFVLGGSVFLGVYPKMKIWWLTGILAWFSATGYAGMDEFHQMLTGGRTPMFQDVMLDSMGALTAVVLCWIVLAFKKNRK
ncbi:hypothetical protein D920_01510 [Enterococcus faecalis 13-SD-W-01]|nr:hypothetical protein D920_01510 [Enterococcus faecalis 13-SD-W-01]